MPSFIIIMIAVVASTAAVMSWKNKDRRGVCLFWLLITISSFVFEDTAGVAISGISKNSEIYLWATSLYYITVAVANFIVIYLIFLSVDSDYEWLVYPILLAMALNILVAMELIFVIKTMDPSITEIKMSQYFYKYRYINKAYRFLAEYLNDIELLLLVVDNHGNRTRIKQFVTGWTFMFYTAPAGNKINKVSSKDEV